MSAQNKVNRRIGLYPGTFDPVTLGHLDIIKRAVKLVDHLVIGVATNASKTPLFTLEERKAMLRREAAPLALARSSCGSPRPNKPMPPTCNSCRRVMAGFTTLIS